MAQEDKGNEPQKQSSDIKQPQNTEASSSVQPSQMSDLKQQQQPVSQPVEGPVKQKPKSSKAIVYIIIAIIVVGGAVLGYGYWNSSQVKAYVSKAEDMRNTSKGWEESFDDNTFSGASALGNIQSPEDLKKDFEKIKSDSDKYLSDLEKTKAPGKAKELEKNLKEYFALTKQIAEEGIYYTEIANELVGILEEVMSDSFLSYGSSTTSEAELVSKFKDAFDEMVDKLEAMTPPDTFKDVHEQMIDTFKEVSDAFETGDVSSLDSLANPFEGLEGADLGEEYAKNAEKADEFEKKIDEQISSLKSLGTFVF